LFTTRRMPFTRAEISVASSPVAPTAASGAGPSSPPLPPTVPVAPSPPETPQQTASYCPKCGNPMTYVAQYSRWYCLTERVYLWAKPKAPLLPKPVEIPFRNRELPPEESPRRCRQPENRSLTSAGPHSNDSPSTPSGQTGCNQLGTHAIDPVSARIASKIFNQCDDRTVSPTTPWAALRSALRCWSSPSSCPEGFTRFPRGASE